MSLGCAFGAQLCNAQQTGEGQGSTSTPAEQAAALQEVVVTAERRTENLQDVPISVDVLSNLDASVGYYYEWQNNYTNAATKYDTAGGTATGVGCRPNIGPSGSAIPGAAPQGSNSSACAGTTQALSGLLDWRPVKRVDVYSGVMFSQVSGGMANGFIKSNNAAFTSGVRVSF